MLKESDVLQSMVDAIDSDTWHQGGFMSHRRGDASACMLGHMVIALGGDLKPKLVHFHDRKTLPQMIVLDDGVTGEAYDLWESIEDRLGDAVFAYTNGNHSAVAQFNDDPATSIEDVKLVCKFALESALIDEEIYAGHDHTD